MKAPPKSEEGDIGGGLLRKRKKSVKGSLMWRAIK